MKKNKTATINHPYTVHSCTIDVNIFWILLIILFIIIYIKASARWSLLLDATFSIQINLSVYFNIK